MVVPDDDRIELSGLGAMLDEETELPYVDLHLHCGGRNLTAAILISEDQWTVNVRDERGRSVPGSGELFPTQADALLAALFIALHVARGRIALGEV